MYQIVDAVAATAEATETYDAMVVGMVCVRNLQPQGAGRYTGKWCYGDELWGHYPEIGNFLHKRTKEIGHKLGLLDEHGGNGMNKKINLNSGDMNYILEQNRGVMVS